MIYIAKPYMANNKDLKEFDNAIDAVEYLNSILTSKEGDEERFDYIFVPPKLSSGKAAKKRLREAIEDYVNIRKLIIKE